MIEFKAVTQQFGNGTIAFQDLSFKVDPGEFVLITGPSGSGKTTIMKLLIAQHQPTQGQVVFADQELTGIKKSQIPQLRRRIGVVFQDYKLLEDLNVWENIALPLCIRKKSQSEIENRVTDLLKLVGLTDKALLFPRQLSGGEAQRVSIARALSTGPKVIFADEPTGNLDAQTSINIVNLLKKINQLGTTLLLATHDSLVLDKLKVRKIELTGLEPAKVKPTKNSELQSETVEESEPVQKKEQESTKSMQEKEKAAASEAKLKAKPKSSRFGHFLNQLNPFKKDQA